MRSVAPADPIEALLDQAEDALDHGDPELAMRLCDEVLRKSHGHAGALFVLGDALQALGRLEEACEAYHRAALRQPDHAASWASLALISFELLRFDEAQRASARAIREDAENAEAWWVRSLLAERKGDRAGAQRTSRHASFLDAESFPPPPDLDDDEIEGIVEESLGTLHPTLREYLRNVAIVLEDVPSDEVLNSYDPPANPLVLLGTFSGAGLAEVSASSPSAQMPGTITLYRRNLERHAENRAELIEELRVTLLHEIGHFLGFDEEDLEARGLD